MIKNLRTYLMIPLISILTLWGCSSRAQAETIISENITEDTIWTEVGSPYILDGSWTVEESATLTIEPGVIVKMRAQSDDSGVLGITGQLNAVGRVDAPIIFTSEADSEAGEWSGLLFIQLGAQRASGQLEHVIVRNGGQSIANIKLDGGADVVLLNSEISQSASNGIEVRLGSSLDIRDTTIREAEIGLSVSQGDLIFQRNTVQAIKSYPLELDADDVDAIEESIFDNNLTPRVHIQRTSGSLSRDVTWRRIAGLKGYELDSTLTVEKNATLTMTSGVNIFLNSNSLAGIYVEGTLMAQGKADDWILFTSDTDTGAGQWDGITFRGGHGKLEYTKIRYGGGSWANVRLTEGANVTINNSTIVGSAKHGLEVNDATLKMNCTTVVNNKQHGILHTSGNSSGNGLTFSRNGGNAVHNLSETGVDFRYNWWDVAPDIEAHITGTVLYDPWLSQPTCELYDLNITGRVESTNMFADEPLTYEFYISNISPNQSPVPSVILSHKFLSSETTASGGSNNITIKSMETTQGVCKQEGSGVRCGLGEIGNGEVIAVTITVIPQTASTLISQTSTESIYSDVNPSNNTINFENNIIQDQVEIIQATESYQLYLPIIVDG